MIVSRFCTAFSLLLLSPSLVGFAQISTSTNFAAGSDITDKVGKAAAGTCSQMTVGQNAGLNGFVPFLPTDAWRTNISAAPVDPNSSAIVGSMGTRGLHPDFGAGTYAGNTIGIPYDIVSGQPTVPVNYQAYGSESDPGPMPIPANAWVEGYPTPSPDDDRHVLVLDRDNCFLYELYSSALQSDGSWNADSGAVWDLLNDNQRPFTWTSADAAGLPIFPGLARYDEVAAGQINHALRFTVQHSRAAFVLPATHWASNSSASTLPAMGTRLRLKASFDISGFGPQSKVILQALKTYGMILADNGSNMYVSGAPDDRWNNDDLHALGNVPPSAFDVVALGTVYTSGNVPTGAAPVITSFGLTGAAARARSVSAGSAVTLTWASTGSSYFVVSPQMGAVRGNSVVVYPTATTTYTLFATNHFGQTTKTVTVNVQ